MALGISRRAVLAGTAGLGLAGLAACGTGGGSGENGNPPGGNNNSDSVLPAYTPVELVKPDVPGTDIVMPAYFSYPQNTEKVFDTPPGEGLEKISIAYTTFQPVPTGPDSNSFWKQLQEDVGTTVELQPVPSSEYTKVFPTRVAGDQLADIMFLPRPVPEMPALLERKFADLGPLLSGDAANDFPYLANIPTASWRWTRANGTIQAVPQHRAVTGAAIFTRPDILAELGATEEPKDFAEFEEMVRTVSDPKQDRWAFSNTASMRTAILSMLGGPNGWSESGGTLTSQYADERYRQALGIMADWVAKEYAHPEAATAPYAQHREYFRLGNTAFLGDGYAAWELLVRMLDGDVSKLSMMVLPKYDGGGDYSLNAGTGIQGITVVNKKLEGDKLRAALNVLNFLAAPIGSAEHLRRKYGVEGKDYTFSDGFPVLTESGTSNFIDLQYVVDSPTIIGPTDEQSARIQAEWHTRVAKNLVLNPTHGLYSETEASKGSALGRELSDVIDGVTYGRNTLEEYDAAVAKWRKDGGDQIAEEYAQAIAEQE
ncbi:extracellular solute-binding protein [Propionibacteriaceae bacterium Y2011]